VKRCPKCHEVKGPGGFYKGTAGACKECRREYMRTRREGNLEHVKAIERRAGRTYRAKGVRRTERFRQAGTSTDPCVNQLYHDPCAYCGGRAGEIDHIEPTSKGGAPKDLGNLTAACRSCNAAKGDKSLLLFMAYRNGCFEYRRDTEVAA